MAQANTSTDRMARARALLAQMTLDEKAGQLQQFFDFGPLAAGSDRLRGHVEKMREALATGRVGSMLFLSKPQDIERTQREHLAASRLKIPLLFGFDVIHGFRTIFPVPIGLAASFDPDLAEACQAVAAREARAVGIHWTFAPMVDIARDGRWGRIVEGAGEDPCLGSAMAAAQVRGFQGGDTGDIAPEGVIAGPKHFAGYGAARGGRDYDEAEISDYELHNVYLPPFKAALDAGARNVMTAYMPLNGMPATANRWLLTEVLRQAWSFDGFVVSDANAVVNLATHGLTPDAQASAVAALRAGLDMEMTVAAAAYAHLPQAVAVGAVHEGELDRSVLRVLEAKLALGLFERPFADAGATAVVLATPEHRSLARRAAARSCVLLQNEGGLLPLGEGMRRIAVLGPLAASARDTLGPWVFEHDLGETVTVADGLRREAEAHGRRVDIAPGTLLPERLNVWPFHALHPEPTADPPPFDADVELDRAVTLAREADVAVVVVGERYDMSGEIASRAGMALPGGQLGLLKAVHATGTPVVLLVMSGRPVDLAWADAQVGAILQVWHPGTQGGAGVADVVFGREPPGGRLPFTWPRGAGQHPLGYARPRSHEPAGRDQRYWDVDGAPLYPFGHGLSYSTFEISPVTLSQTEAKLDATVVASARVLNTGAREADAVLQLYMGQRWGSSARPEREMKAFRRVRLAAGKEAQVAFDVTPAHRTYWSGAARAWTLEAADVEIRIALDAVNGEAALLTLLP